MDKSELKDQLDAVKLLLDRAKSAPLFEQPAIARQLMARTLVILEELIARIPDGEQ